MKSIFLFLYKQFFRLVGIVTRKNQKLIVFESFLGKQYSDNPRALYEYLKSKKDFNDYKLIWSVSSKNTDVFRQNDVEYIKRFSLKWIFAMNRAKIWISNSRLPLWIPKPRGTIYLQTWHGTPLKKLALDMDEVYMPGTDTLRYKKNFTTESKKWDYLISPNAYSTEIFKRAFDFRKVVLETGYPRNDFLVNNDNKTFINRLKIEMGIPRDKKVILYAPTWRDNEYYEKGRYKLNLNLDLDLLKEKFEENYVILLRMHYLVSENLNLNKYKNFVKDLSNYEDIRELYLVSDILITDYSSVFFDYAILERPILFFTYDIELYRDKVRGFYFDFEDKAPGPLVKTTVELVEEIYKLESNNFKINKQLLEFKIKFCKLEDGCASERVFKNIL